MHSRGYFREKGQKVIYHGSGWNLTVREAVFSIAIFFLMLMFGFFLSEKIASSLDEQNQEYYQAVKIDGDAEVFQYGMRTNIGNAFVSGVLEAVDPVTYPELGGEYAYVEKIKEEYTKHTKTVDDYDEDGNKIGSHKEEYWTWDVVGREEIHCGSLRFLGSDFDYGKIRLPDSYYLETIKKWSDTRYKYYVVDASYEGSIYADLRDKSINGAVFIVGCNAHEAEERMASSGKGVLVGFWLFWIVLTGFAIYGFCYFDNRWLED
jgi:hypothetical protein